MSYMVQKVPERGYADLACVDDVVVMARGRNNEEMRRMVQFVLGAYHDDARKRGFQMKLCK